MFGFLKALSVSQRVLACVAFAVFIAAAIIIGRHFVDRSFDTAEKAGAAIASGKAAEKGLANVEAANRAAEDVASDPVVRDADCVRHSRTPENC